MIHPRGQYPFFIERLEDYVPREAGERGAREGGNRAALAALRRGLGKRPGEAPEMYPYLIPLLPPDIDRGSEWGEESYYIVAALFALYPSIQRKAADEKDNLGATMRSLARAIQRERNPRGDEDGDKSVERRFVALLNATTIDLSEHLRHAVSLIKSKGDASINVNWAQLLYDVQDWDDPRHRVQLRWAGAFWRPYTMREDTDDGHTGTNTEALDAV